MKMCGQYALVDIKQINFLLLVKGKT